MHINRSTFTSVLIIALLGVTSACGETKTEEQRMSDATTAFEAGQYRAALIELKNLLQENPKNKDARVMLASASLQIGDPDAAAKELERAERLGASPAEIYTLQQSTWLRLGRFEDLIENYSPDKSASDDERAEMQLVYAKALNGLENTEAAAAEFQKLADSNAASNWRAEGLVGLAMIARAQDDDEQGKAYAEQAVAADSGSASAYIMLGQIALANANFDEAYDRFSQGGKAELLNEEQKFVLISGELESALGIPDLEASKDAANRLFTLAPEHPVTNYLLARVAYANDDKDMAHERNQKVLSEYPEFMPAQFLQGAMSMERNEYPQAEMFLSNVVAAQPGNFEARRMLAEANLQLGNSSTAANLLREGIKLGPGADQLASMLGRVNLQLGKVDDSTGQLEQVLENNPDDEQARLALVASHIAAGRADEAQKLMEGSSDSEAITPERKAIVKLIAAIQSKNRQAAISQSDIILATWPNNPQTHAMIGAWFASEGLMEKARTTLESGFAKFPDNAGLLGTLSKLDNSQGKSEQAEARFQTFLNETPNSVDGWLAYASMHAANSGPEKVIEILRDAREANPDEPLPSVVLARFLMAQKQLREASQIAEELANLNEQNALSQFIYGRVLFEQGQHDLALEYLKKANSIRGGVAETVVYKARTEARLNLLAQAKSSYEELWELLPGNLEAGQSIALLEMRKGNNAAANEQLKKLREFRPDDVRVDIIDADLKVERGNNKAAYALYEQAYAVRPSRDLALKIARLAPGQGEESESVLRRWLKQSPDDVAARLVLAQDLQQSGKNAAAISEYEVIVRSRPDDGLVLNNLAWLHFEGGAAGSRERSLELAKRAYEQSPNNAQIADTYGWILFRTGEVEQGKAVLALAESSARDQGLQDSRDITYHYAAAMSESGDRAGARLRLRDILSDSRPFYSREDAQRLLDSLAR